MKEFLIKYYLGKTGIIKEIKVIAKTALHAVKIARMRLSILSDSPIIIMVIYEKIDIIKTEGD